MASHQVYRTVRDDGTVALHGDLFSSLEDAVDSLSIHGMKIHPHGQPLKDHRTGRIKIDMGGGLRIEVVDLDFGDE